MLIFFAPRVPRFLSARADDVDDESSSGTFLSLYFSAISPSHSLSAVFVSGSTAHFFVVLFLAFADRVPLFVVLFFVTLLLFDFVMLLFKEAVLLDARLLLLLATELPASLPQLLLLTGGTSASGAGETLRLCFYFSS